MSQLRLASIATNAWSEREAVALLEQHGLQTSGILAQLDNADQWNLKARVYNEMCAGHVRPLPNERPVQEQAVVETALKKRADEAARVWCESLFPEYAPPRDVRELDPDRATLVELLQSYLGPRAPPPKGCNWELVSRIEAFRQNELMNIHRDLHGALLQKMGELREQLLHAKKGELNANAVKTLDRYVSRVTALDTSPGFEEHGSYMKGFLANLELMRGISEFVLGVAARVRYEDAIRS